ncbi:MAG: hypothetical protein MJZ50_05790 [Treponema sp.]|nr:hypothetical protein [Treponema sp.]
MAEEFEREKPLYGRKIFFMNASHNIREVATTRLREMEYETYIIDEHQYAKAILRSNPDSICIINLDHVGKDSMEVIQYLNFIISCEKDETLSSIIFGVTSVNTSSKQMNLFFFNTQLGAGYIPASPNRDDLTETLSVVFEINGAKGRRQYVRASCEASGTAFINITMGVREFKFPLVDFSSIGLACQIPNEMAGFIPEKTLLNKVDLYLMGEKLKVSLVVLKDFKKGEKSILVTLLAPSVTLEVKSKLREYVFRVLESDIFSRLDLSNPDNEVYSTKIEKKDAVVNVDDLNASEGAATAELEEL